VAVRSYRGHERGAGGGRYCAGVSVRISVRVSRTGCAAPSNVAATPDLSRRSRLGVADLDRVELSRFIDSS
jgi:hypothetical protein